MEDKYFALIKDGLVEGVIVADENFINSIKDNYDYTVDVTNIDRPACGDSYYNDTQTFISNQLTFVDITIEEDLPVPNGTEVGFAPFKLSRYTVKYEDGNVVIGCKYFPAVGLRDALYIGLVEHASGTVACFTAEDEGPYYGKYGITWDDAQLLYDALVRMNLE